MPPSPPGTFVHSSQIEYFSDQIYRPSWDCRPNISNVVRGANRMYEMISHYRYTSVHIYVNSRIYISTYKLWCGKRALRLATANSCVHICTPMYVFTQAVLRKTSLRPATANSDDGVRKDSWRSATRRSRCQHHLWDVEQNPHPQPAALDWARHVYSHAYLHICVYIFMCVYICTCDICVHLIYICMRPWARAANQNGTHIQHDGMQWLALFPNGHKPFQEAALECASTII